MVFYFGIICRNLLGSSYPEVGSGDSAQQADKTSACHRPARPAQQHIPAGWRHFVLEEDCLRSRKIYLESHRSLPAGRPADPSSEHHRTLHEPGEKEDKGFFLRHVSLEWANINQLTFCFSLTSATISFCPTVALKWQTAASPGRGKTKTASIALSSLFS